MKKLGLTVFFSLCVFTFILAQTVYITRTGEKYHSQGCRYLSRSCIPVSLSDAKSQGYSACSVCDPPVRVVKRKAAPHKKHRANVKHYAYQ